MPNLKKKSTQQNRCVKFCSRNWCEEANMDIKRSNSWCTITLFWFLECNYCVLCDFWLLDIFCCRATCIFQNLSSPLGTWFVLVGLLLSCSCSSYSLPPSQYFHYFRQISLCDFQSLCISSFSPQLCIAFTVRHSYSAFSQQSVLRCFV